MLNISGMFFCLMVLKSRVILWFLIWFKEVIIGVKSLEGEDGEVVIGFIEFLRGFGIFIIL